MRILQILRKLRSRKADKANAALNARYMTIGVGTFLQQPRCLDFRVQPEERKYVTIGEKCLIRGTFTFESTSGEVRIGNNTQLGGVQMICRSGITIGNDVTMAWGITLYDHDSHPVDWEYRQHDNDNNYRSYVETGGDIFKYKDWSHVKTAPIVVEDKVWIGMDVLVLKGVTIGEGAVVAAKSVVTKDVPPYTLVAGNPARVVKQLK